MPGAADSCSAVRFDWWRFPLYGLLGEVTELKGRVYLAHAGLVIASKIWSIVPEILEPVGRELRVAHRVLDILVPHVELDGADVVAVVALSVSTRLPYQFFDADVLIYSPETNTLGERSSTYRAILDRSGSMALLTLVLDSAGATAECRDEPVERAWRCP
jgi:hypothetical protein